MKISALLIVGLLSIFLPGCASVSTSTTSPSSGLETILTSQTTMESTLTEAQPIEVEKNLFDVKITFPASLFIGEGVDEASIEAEAKKQGIHEVVFNDDNSITYVMDKSTHQKLLADMKANIDESINSLIDGETSIESFSRIEYNNDFTEFNVYVDGQQYNEMDSISAIQFYILGGFYQVINGVDSEKTDVTVKFIDKDTGTVLNTANSSEALNN